MTLMGNPVRHPSLLQPTMTILVSVRRVGDHGSLLLPGQIINVSAVMVAGRGKLKVRHDATAIRGDMPFVTVIRPAVLLCERRIGIARGKVIARFVLLARFSSRR